jgi:hypothetical protein
MWRSVSLKLIHTISGLREHSPAITALTDPTQQDEF